MLILLYISENINIDNLTLYFQFYEMKNIVYHTDLFFYSKYVVFFFDLYKFHLNWFQYYIDNI